jgi:hypothetical protein
MSLRKDIWRSGILEAPLAEILARGSVADIPFRWLPDEGPLRYLADPFGVWRDGRLFVFVEAYDHRVRHGAIHVIEHDAELGPVRRRIALREPWHLSYPQVFASEGEVWMLPEAVRSGRLTLYRATAFPTSWERFAVLDVDPTAVDVTPLFLDGGWWLFYGAGVRAAGRPAELRCAFADRLTGPWREHPGNPIRTDASSCRPGGSATVADGRVTLPVQDCSTTYGGAVRALTFTTLDRATASASLGEPITAPPAAAPYLDGLHTLSDAGRVTLFDAKVRGLSAAGLLSDVARLGRRLLGRGPPTGAGAAGPAGCGPSAAATSPSAGGSVP